MAHKVDNLEEMDQFLERHKAYTRRDNLNRLTPINEIESIIINLPKQKVLGPDDFMGEF